MFIQRITIKTSQSRMRHRLPATKIFYKLVSSPVIRNQSLKKIEQKQVSTCLLTAAF